MRTGLKPGSGARIPGLREILEHPLGPTPWQLNWWVRKGYVDLGGAGEPISEETQRTVIEFSRLFRAGMRAKEASCLVGKGTVSRGGRRVIPVGDGVTIILHAADRVDT